MSEKKSILKEQSFLFALAIIGVYKELSEDKRENILSKQLLRSGTSVGANIREAKNAQSRADFRSAILTTKQKSSNTQIPNA